VLLIFDTAATPNIINQRLFNSLGLSALGQGTLAGAGGTVQGQFAKGVAACIAYAGNCPASATPTPPTESVWIILRREMLATPAGLS
jgi:hypothetical protein